MRKVLFLCTGNFYRSRFCEALFNDMASKKPAGWSAFSRGLAIDLADDAVIEHGGEISNHTKERLSELGVSISNTSKKRRALTRFDLNNADIVIAVKEDEHRPMMKESFPDWEDKVNYWDIGDLWHGWTPKKSLEKAEVLVKELYSLL